MPAPAVAVALEELATAQAAAPYPIREPAWLPDGFVLDRVLFSTEGCVVSVDLDYRTAEHVVHIWETNIPAEELARVGKDPLTTRNPTPVQIEGVEWVQKELEAPGGTLWYLATRLPDGVTIAIDGTVDLESLKRIAASLASS